MPKIYLDNAAAAPIAPEVQKEMARAMKLAGNPSSFNDAGRAAAAELSKARLAVARFLGAHTEEIIFTSSGSEANNLAIQGIARNFKFLILNLKTKSKFQRPKPHIITTQIEHPSVLEPIKWLEKEEGFDVTYLSVDKEGSIDLKELQNALRLETILVSVMYANNEIGTIEQITKIGKIIKEFRLEIRNSKLEINGKLAWPIFHVDACQAAGYLNMNVNALGADLLSFNGSKIYGPRGIGVLYVRKGVKIKPLVLGGGQERGLRAGTENLPAIMGLAKAIALIKKDEGKKMTELRDYFIGKLERALPGARINGALGNERLANNVNISIPGLDSENLLLELDKYGISAGSGSACTARSVEPSHVLKAIGVEKKYLSGALRFSLGRDTKKSDLDYVAKVLPKIVGDLKRRYKKIK